MEEVPRLDLRPNAARMYDYNLGGNHNFAADRSAMDAINALFAPGELAHVGQSNRAFLARAVRYCLDEGITQFLDLGSGIPTVGNVHEIVRSRIPAARVVYVDNEPVAVSQTRRMLAGNPQAAIVDADLRDPDTVLDTPEVRSLLDFRQPVALLAVAALHYVDHDADVTGILRRYLHALAPGSVLAISHLTPDGRPQVVPSATTAWADTVSEPMTMRTRGEVTAFFDGLELMDPGVVWTVQWRPDSPLDPRWPVEACWAGVGQVPMPPSSP